VGDCDVGRGCGAGESDGETDVENRISIVAMQLRLAMHQLQAKLQCR
jgi:hypothetical protein